VLRIVRSQVPLAPAFAMTAHASQGQTFKQGCIVDLRIGRGTNPIASYVAMTRVQRREDMVIYRPFERELFNRGPKRGPHLLLTALRGEAIDWAAIEQEFMPRARCYGCNFIRFKCSYALQQWSRQNKQPYCKDCVDKKKRLDTPLQCNTCYMWKAEIAFKVAQRHPNCINTRVCIDCVEKRRCKECGEAKIETEFAQGEWTRARWKVDRGLCKDCSKKERGRWRCIECKTQKDSVAFSAWVAGHASTNKKRRCDVCASAQAQAHADLAAQNIQHVQKIRRTAGPEA
jgi:hypothetical protein